MSFDLHPTHLAGGIYQEMGIRAAQSAHTFFAGDQSRKEYFSNLDGFYRLSKNVASNGGTALQFFAGLRWVDWRDVPTLVGHTDLGPFAIPYPQFALMPSSGAPVSDLARMSHKSSTALRYTGTGADFVGFPTSQGVDPASPANLLEAHNSTRSPFARDEFCETCGLGIETQNFSQAIGDIGFNWEGRYSRKWQLKNRVWGIDGLKHVVKPYVQMRHNPASEPAGLGIPEEMVYARDTNLPNWDLATRRDMVFAQEQTLARVGLKNQVFTRRKDYGSRELANWNVAADYFFAGPFEDDISFLYSEFSFAPAQWLEIGTFSRFSSDNLELRELNSRVRIQDSDLWYVQYSNALAEGFGPGSGPYAGLYPFLEVDQHSLEIGYKVNDRFRLMAWVRYDFVIDDFSEQHLSLFQKFGRAMEVEYRLSVRENALREEGWAFRMGIQLVSF